MHMHPLWLPCAERRRRPPGVHGVECFQTPDSRARWLALAIAQAQYGKCKSKCSHHVSLHLLASHAACSLETEECAGTEE